VTIETLRKVRWFLDEAFRVPGTSIRVGWDPIIGLVPWVGDLLTALMHELGHNLGLDQLNAELETLEKQAQAVVIDVPPSA
jgi:hypothetical protein